MTLFLQFLVFFLAPVTPKWDFGSVSIILDLFWIYFGSILEQLGAVWSSLEPVEPAFSLIFLKTLNPPTFAPGLVFALC